jgi:uncharacterized protein (UPF0261 family)
MYIYLIATLDTKGLEADFVRQRLLKLGHTVRLLDAGCLGTNTVHADLSREQVYAAAGTSLQAMQQQGDRGLAVQMAAQGVTNLIAQAYARHELTGVIALGGSAGTTIGTCAMRSLPLGVPKIMVSTLASGQTRPYVADKDILMLNSVVDIAGLNRISRTVLGEAAAAMAGMVQYRQSEQEDNKPIIAATMFGVTTPCVQHARKILEAAGYEVLVFHATGNGGQAMESLIRDGLILGVLDITTTELADELVGGILSAGPTRLTAASAMGIPQVVSVGALDMVNFGPIATVPEKFRERKLHAHNATVTLMRTTREENTKLGEEIIRKLSDSTGSVAVLLPLQGVSAIDKAGQPFDDAFARAALFNGMQNVESKVEIIHLDLHINDAPFAEAAARKLLTLIAKAS